MRGYVYLIGSERFGWYKIGKAKNPEVRIRDLGILLPFQIRVFAVWKSDNCDALETELHWKYTSYNINGEWFRFRDAELRRIVFEELAHLQTIYLAGANPESHFARFSNLLVEKSKRNKPFLSPVQCVQYRQMSHLKKQAMFDWLKSRNLTDTRQNRILARAAIADIDSSSEASSERLQPGLILKG